MVKLGFPPLLDFRTGGRGPQPHLTRVSGDSPGVRPPSTLSTPYQLSNDLPGGEMDHAVALVQAYLQANGAGPGASP